MPGYHFEMALRRRHCCGNLVCLLQRAYVITPSTVFFNRKLVYSVANNYASLIEYVHFSDPDPDGSI